MYDQIKHSFCHSRHTLYDKSASTANPCASSIIFMQNFKMKMQRKGNGIWCLFCNCSHWGWNLHGKQEKDLTLFSPGKVKMNIKDSLFVHQTVIETYFTQKLSEKHVTGYQRHGCCSEFLSTGHENQWACQAGNKGMSGKGHLSFL